MTATCLTRHHTPATADAFHELQVFGAVTYKECDWKTAFRSFNDGIISGEPGAMMRPYLFVEGITLRYDAKDDFYYIYGDTPSVPEDEEFSDITWGHGRVVQSSLYDTRGVQEAIALFLTDDTYTILGLYMGKATETRSPMFMIKKTEDPHFFILKAENLLQREDEALEMAIMRSGK